MADRAIPSYETPTLPNLSGPSTTPSKDNWWRERCLPHMVHMFVHLRQTFIKRYETLNRQTLDAKDIYWFWITADDEFNAMEKSDISDNLFVVADTRTQKNLGCSIHIQYLKLLWMLYSDNDKIKKWVSQYTSGSHECLFDLEAQWTGWQWRW